MKRHTLARVAAPLAVAVGLLPQGGQQIDAAIAAAHDAAAAQGAIPATPLSVEDAYKLTVHRQSTQPYLVAGFFEGFADDKRSIAAIRQQVGNTVYRMAFAVTSDALRDQLLNASRVPATPGQPLPKRQVELWLDLSNARHQPPVPEWNGLIFRSAGTAVLRGVQQEQQRSPHTTARDDARHIHIGARNTTESTARTSATRVDTSHDR